MKRYKIVGKILLSFIMRNEQHDFLFDDGTIEYDGKNTIWFVDDENKKLESITTANIIDIALRKGDIVEIN